MHTMHCVVCCVHALCGCICMLALCCILSTNPVYNWYIEGKSIQSLGEKNSAASSKWKCMEPEEKTRYHQMARKFSVDPTPDVSAAYYKLHEAHRVVTRIQENVN